MSPFIDHPRLKALGQELRPGAGPCPFIVESPSGVEFDVQHYSGGRDATYIIISRGAGTPPGPGNATANVRYAPFVEGTAIIYDVTAESIQGKARPFVCDLSQHEQRVYALLPVQIEASDGALDTSRPDKKLRLRFACRDAQRQPIEAALPFELKFYGPGAPLGPVLQTSYLATNRQGIFSIKWESLIAVNSPVHRTAFRSLLTGW